MKQAQELLEKYNAGLASPEEKAMVESWYLKYKTAPSTLTPEELLYEFNIGLPQLKHRLGQHKTVKWWSRVAVAASLLLCVGVGLVLLQKQSPKKAPTMAVHQPKAITPGTNKAILTLADGRKITLESEQNGNLAEQAGVNIVKHADGRLAYEDHNGIGNAVAINVLQTPRGGQYQLQLPDGTKVWLNSASTIKYPSRFADDKREITLTGEAYFEVAKKATDGQRVPFIVSTGLQRIEVLGTHFNIKDYESDHETATTLLEGSVRVTPLQQPSKAMIITPAQQAITNSDKLTIKTVDVDEVIAWKNGYFVFEDEDIQSIMTVLSRWYDVDVVYKGEITKQKFGGAFPRSSNINDLLKYMESYGNVNFKVEGRRIIVMP